jgi:hypothetical protein
VLWHIVKFRFRPEVSAADRTDFAHRLEGMDESIAELRAVHVAPSVDEPDVLGLITCLDDEAALAVYADHPAHVPVADRGRELCEEIIRLDMVTS